MKTSNEKPAFYAQIDLFHGTRIIKKGTRIPSDIIGTDLETLIASGAVSDNPKPPEIVSLKSNPLPTDALAQALHDEKLRGV